MPHQVCNCSNPDQTLTNILNIDTGKEHIIRSALYCAVECAVEKTFDEFAAGKYSGDPLKAIVNIARNFSGVLALQYYCDKIDCGFINRYNQIPSEWY